MEGNLIDNAMNKGLANLLTRNKFKKIKSPPILTNPM
jgi:hypothetical protein